MRLCRINITNFRSIKATGDVSLGPLQAFVGENNCGKSNILRAVQCFLSPGAGGVEPGDFNDQSEPASIECEFRGLTESERRKLRAYLLGYRVILRKEMRIEIDTARRKASVKTDYHGYRGEPKELCYSITKIVEKGGKPDWAALAEAGGFLPAAATADDKVNKTSFIKALDRFLVENDVEYETLELGETQALGIPQNLLAALPESYMLPAITDYSDEIDRRSTTTVFRTLMGDLSERLLRVDSRYKEIEQALARIKALLNVEEGQNAPARLEALGTVETQLTDTVRRLMPSIKGVNLSVEIEESRDVFEKA
jgi:putative ATP-dependent endonuclease of OLD family